jgi:hypothetical protein
MQFGELRDLRGGIGLRMTWNDRLGRSTGGVENEVLEQLLGSANVLAPGPKLDLPPRVRTTRISANAPPPDATLAICFTSSVSESPDRRSDSLGCTHSTRSG